MFGSTLSQTTGSTVKFDPIKSTDQMLKGGNSQTISTKLMCLTAMKAYENKSVEEIRVEDYQANRTQPPAGGLATSSPFGQTTQTNAFGGGGTSSLFGNKPATASPFGQTTTGAFGGQQQQQTSLFGQQQNKPATGGLFGNTSSPFGGTAASSTGGSSLFGNKPAFGQQSTAGSMFGNATTTTQSNQFSFGQAKPAASSAFGTTSAFGQTQQSTNLFGNTQQTPKPIFGSTPSQPTSTNLFGNTAAPAQTSSIFGGGAPATQQAGSIFGNTAQPAQTSIFGNQPAASTGGSIFGNTTQQQPAGGSIFGNTQTQQPASTSLFGNATQPNAFGGGANAFGAKPGATGMFGQAQPAQQATGGFQLGGVQPIAQAQPIGQSVLQVPSQQIVITQDTEQTLRQSIISSQMSLYPYGSDSLLKNFSVQGLEPDPKATFKSQLEKERLINTFAASKAANLDSSADKAKLDEGMKKFNQVVLTTKKPSVFNYKPLVQRSLNDSRASENGNLSESNLSLDKSSTFSQLQTGVFIPTVVSASKRRNDPKNFDTSILKNRSKVDESVLNRTGNVTTTSSISLAKTLHFSEKTRSSPDNSLISNGDVLNTSLDKSVSMNKTLNTSVTSTLEVSNDENGLNKTLINGPCNVIITSRSIYTEPSLEELENFVVDGRIRITESFKVGRLGYGSILWEGPFEFNDVDLNEIIKFHRKEVVVYPDESKKPTLGQEFNRPAIVTLESVYPVDRVHKNQIRDPNHPEMNRFAQMLEKKCLKMGCSFIDYNPEEGLWIFKVKHFSKYGFYDDDEDDEQILIQQKKLQNFTFKQDTAVQTPIEEDFVQMDDVDELLATEAHAPCSVLQQRMLNFDESFNHTMADPKRLFITDSPEVVERKRMRLTEDVFEYEQEYDFFTEEVEKVDLPIVCKRVNKIGKFQLTDPIFEQLKLTELLKPVQPMFMRRIGFGPSDSLQVTVLTDPASPSSAVHIKKIKLVPTIESYLKKYLAENARDDDFEPLINTELLRMNPPSDLIKTVDDYLFNELRLNHTLQEVNIKMDKFCAAMCQPHTDLRFSALQRAAFQKWLQEELQEKLTSQLELLPNASAYAKVYYALMFADFQRGIDIAKANGLTDLALIIGLYSSGTRVPERLLRFQKLTFEHVKDGADPYRARIFALLGQIFDYTKNGKKVKLLANIPVLQSFAVHIRLFSTFKSSLQSNLDALGKFTKAIHQA